MQAAKRYKTVIEVIPDDSEGEIDLEALESLLTCGNRKPALIAISHIPTSSGPDLLTLRPSTTGTVPF